MVSLGFKLTYALHAMHKCKAGESCLLMSNALSLRAKFEIL